MDGGGGWGIIARGLGILAGKLKDHLGKFEEVLNEEKRELRASVIELNAVLERASSRAQRVVRSSPNSDQLEAIHLEAVEAVTTACQRAATLFPTQQGHVLTQGYLNARLAFREAAMHEDNPSLVDQDQREARCAEIEAACAAFSQEISLEAFRRYGVGVGVRAGRRKGRRRGD